VDAPVRQSLYAAGGRLTLAAPVQRNVRIAGGSLEIAPSARVAGNVSAAGGEVRVLGPIDGYLVVGAGRVFINAAVAGDVDVRAGRIDLGPQAAIAGKLRYASPDELVRDPAAQVGGGAEPTQRGSRRTTVTKQRLWRSVWRTLSRACSAFGTGRTPALQLGR
jgi:cytoskeletal protein CcmA (bactofilin family)